MADALAPRMQGLGGMANRIPDKGADRGGMTGATGNLTPDNADEEFVPAETRELTDPASVRRRATSHRRTAVRRAEGSEPEQLPEPGSERELGGDERREPEEEHF